VFQAVAAIQRASFVGAQMAKRPRTCFDCGSQNFVEDHAAGDLICRVSTTLDGCWAQARLLHFCTRVARVPFPTPRLTVHRCLCAQDCGVVNEAHLIDERSEWRTFSDKVRHMSSQSGRTRSWVAHQATIHTYIWHAGQGDGRSKPRGWAGEPPAGTVPDVDRDCRQQGGLLGTNASTHSLLYAYRSDTLDVYSPGHLVLAASQRPVSWAPSGSRFSASLRRPPHVAVLWQPCRLPRCTRLWQWYRPY
jgi:hypothetical protein